jgi:predicted transcriptional regulator
MLRADQMSAAAQHPGFDDEAPSGDDLQIVLATVIAERVREYRHQLELTVGPLAERSGLSKGMLSKIENAQTSPSLATLGRLSTALSVPVTAFFRVWTKSRMS